MILLQISSLVLRISFLRFAVIWLSGGPSLQCTVKVKVNINRLKVQVSVATSRASARS